METGTKLYRVSWSSGMLSPRTDAELETVTFIEESIAEGASRPTYLVRHGNLRKVRVATDYYYETADAAWQAMVTDIQEGIAGIEKQMAEQQELLFDCKTQLTKAVNQRMAALKQRKDEIGC